MRIALALATLVGVCMLLGAAPSTAPVAAATTPPGGGQPPDPGSDQLIAIVESFLLARAMGDFAGAAGWCASLLELQDSDGSWFVDAPSTREWLRQLANRYVIDTLTHPTAESNTVVWTERLSQRGIPFPEALRSSISVQVHAVIRDGKIAYLSGPYPPIPFRSGSASGEPGLPGGPTSAPAIHPFTLFVGSALGLAVAVPLANVLSPALYTAVLHGWKWRSSPVQRNHPRGIRGARHTARPG